MAFAANAGAAHAAAASPSVSAAVGVPTPGAGAPSGTTFDLGQVGYTESEFFVAGNASSYHNVDGQPFASNGLWTIEPDATPTPAFKTRIQVYRPANPAHFSGVVIVEWLNVTNQSDSAADWILAHNEIIREGHVYIGATVQAIGVNAARALDPTRYGAAGANLVHPGDAYSYDIFSQVGQAVRDNQGAILGGLPLGHLIGIGESQSATRLVTYIDALGKLHDVYDGYYVHSRGATGAALRANLTAVGLANIATPSTTLIRSDLGVPVFVLQAETDTRATRQPDSNIFRQWESAGSAHADMYTLGIGQVDTGTDNEAAKRLLDAMLNPQTEPLPGLVAPCTIGVNSGPHHWVVQSSLHHLVVWVADGTNPPPGAFLTTVGSPTGALVLDANGNAAGGVRSPHVDVPVATIRGTGNTSAGGGAINFCSLFGTTVPFTEQRLSQLYRNHGAFVSGWSHATNAAVRAGYILAADAPLLKSAAAESGIGKK